MLPIYEGLKSL